MTYEDCLTAPDWEEVDGATGMQVKIRVVASRAVTLDLINPNEKTLARMSAIAARPYACHGGISASQLKSIKEKIKETIKNIGSRVSRRQDRISNYPDDPRNLPQDLYELVYTASHPRALPARSGNC